MTRFSVLISLVCLASFLVFIWLVDSIEFRWAGHVVFECTFASSRTTPADVVSIQYVCAHGRVWGLSLDFGYKNWLHNIFGSRQPTGECRH